jgi:hypothetical protein
VPNEPLDILDILDIDNASVEELRHALKLLNHQHNELIKMTRLHITDAIKFLK